MRVTMKLVPDAGAVLNITFTLPDECLTSVNTCSPSLVHICTRGKFMKECAIGKLSIDPSPVMVAE